MDLNLVKIKLEENLSIHLEHCLPHHAIKEGHRYAVFPPGKLFRPQLVWAIYQDLAVPQTDEWGPSFPHALLASALELHHAYTLAHDDLPCMDNGMERRGKPSLHRAFGEWQALLIGDGLLNASYQLLANIPQVMKVATWCLGPKGLIQGQVLDLSQEMTHDFPTLRLTHLYKTGRLIQCALISSFLLISPHERRTKSPRLVDLLRLGEAIGLSFQFLDDLTEFIRPLDAHEEQINCWANFEQQSAQELLKNLQTLERIIKQSSLPVLAQVLSHYFLQIKKQLEEGQKDILNHWRKLREKKGMNLAANLDLTPVMIFLNRLSQGHEPL
ncbi:MAG: polyprenyl synthetase family protein [Pseudomonadota bacterium]